MIHKNNYVSRYHMKCSKNFTDKLQTAKIKLKLDIKILTASPAIWDQFFCCLVRKRRPLHNVQLVRSTLSKQLRKTIVMSMTWHSWTNNYLNLDYQNCYYYYLYCYCCCDWRWHLLNKIHQTQTNLHEEDCSPVHRYLNLYCDWLGRWTLH